MKFSATFVLWVASAVQLASAAPIFQRAPSPSGWFAPIPTVGGLPPPPDLTLFDMLFNSLPIEETSAANKRSLADTILSDPFFNGINRVPPPFDPSIFNDLLSDVKTKRLIAEDILFKKFDPVALLANAEKNIKRETESFDIFPGLNQPLVVDPTIPFLTGLTPVSLDPAPLDDAENTVKRDIDTFDVFPGLNQPLVVDPKIPFLTGLNPVPLDLTSFSDDEQKNVKRETETFDIFPGLDQPLVVDPTVPFLTGLTPVTVDRRLKFSDPCKFPVGFKGLIPIECTAPQFVPLPTPPEAVQPSTDIASTGDVRKRVNCNIPVGFAGLIPPECLEGQVFPDLFNA